MSAVKEEINNVIKWTADYVGRTGANGVVVGLSGGIDSCMSAALAVQALGAKNVLGVMMPCDSNSKDMEDAQLVADWLGIYAIKINLGYPFDELERRLEEDGNLGAGNGLKQMTIANIKARLRMTTLYAIANQRNMLVCGTTNKSEAMVGYYTKYGDGGVDIEPLMDYYKTEVYEMAAELNVPQQIIDREPSAGLWDGQTDADELGMDYDRLDMILEAINGETNEALDPQYISEKDIINIEKRINANLHKGQPAPFYNRNPIGCGGGCGMDGCQH